MVVWGSRTPIRLGFFVHGSSFRKTCLWNARGWRILPDHVVSVVGWGTDPEEGQGKSHSLSRWWQLKYVLFSPLFGEDEPILTSIFFRWVVQPPTSYIFPSAPNTFSGKYLDPKNLPISYTKSEGSKGALGIWSLVIVFLFLTKLTKNWHQSAKTPQLVLVLFGPHLGMMSYKIWCNHLLETSGWKGWACSEMCLDGL